MSRKHLDTPTCEQADREAAATAQRIAPLGRSTPQQFADQGPSILNPAVYEALRRKGYSKEKAARISNAMG